MKSLLRLVIVSTVIVPVVATSAIAGQANRRPAPQRVDPMTGTIKGMVTAADTGAPLRGAEVRLSSRGSYNRLVTTDSDGLFNLRDLPSGEYRLTASRSGFTSLLFGQRRPLEAPTSINLAEGATFTANLALVRGGAIHGRVIDRYGDPIAGTRVQVLRSRMVQGQRRLQSMGPGDQSDDTGAFRVYGLPPGDYYVTASGGPIDSTRREPPLFYPGTSSLAEAQPITLAAGGEAEADFQLQPLRYARVSGVVLNASGAPIQAMVRLASESIGMGPVVESGGAPTAFSILADSSPDGRFTLENVPPGSYQLIANGSFGAGLAAGLAAGDPTARPNKAMQELMMHGPETATMALVVTGDDVSGITLTTRLGGVVKGTFAAASGVVQTLPTSLRVVARGGEVGSGMMMQGGVGDGFQLAGMSGPFFLEVQGLPEGWTVSQIMLDGSDVTDEAIDLKGRTADVRVLLTNRVSTVSGMVQSRRAPSGYSVIVFPDDASRWAYPSRYVKTARADERGAFRIQGLPANERYLALAVDYLEEGEEQDAQFLERLRGRAMTFALSEGEQRSVVLEPITR